MGRFLAVTGNPAGGRPANPANPGSACVNDQTHESTKQIQLETVCRRVDPPVGGGPGGPARHRGPVQFPYVTEDCLLIDERAGGAYFWITYLPKSLGGGTFYLTGLRTKDGELLNGTDTYRLTVPADTPAKDFWSVIVYSMRTKGFVEGVDRVGLSSLELPNMRKNTDGSVEIYFSPKAPEGLESNWIPTGEDFFLLFRLYGPDKALFERSWTLPDVERIR